LPHSSIEFENIFAAGSIDLDTLGLDGEVPPAPPLPSKPPATHQVMRFKIPVEKIAVVTERIEKVMREFNYTAEDSLSNAGAALVHVFEKG
jgi:ParB family chromosome partitioning protein